MALISSSLVTYEIEVPEGDVRAQLVQEAAELHGLTHDGKLIPGVTAKVTFDGRHGGGTYKVRLTRDTTKSGQAQLAGPR